MAEVIAAGASIIAIIQIADRIIGLCKGYIEAARDAPSDLRLILIETSALKVILENLEFLTKCGGRVSAIALQISGADGPIEGCLRAMTELEKLFPSDGVQTGGPNSSKRKKVKFVLTTLAWPLKQTKARKLLDEIMRYKSTISLALTSDFIQDIKQIKEKALEIHDMLTDSQRQGVYQWLYRTDPSPLHHHSRKDYETGTGDWVLRTPEWVGWLAGEHRCLWIHGIPGAGKTVLMSHLIDQIEKRCDQIPHREVVSIYYYCYFARKQDEAKPLLKWLLHQLCRKARYVPTLTYMLYEKWTEPSLPELLEALAQMIVTFGTVYIAIDALDESSSQDDILCTLRILVTDPRFERLRVVTSSRDYLNIERTMLNISTSISMNNPFVEQDIRRCVHSMLKTNPKFKRWPLDLLQEVEESVTIGARGMFRWAVCQIDVLQRLKCERANVQMALNNLPKTMNETYDRILLTAPEEDRLFIDHALRWIAYHNDIYHSFAMPSKILIEATEASILDLTGSRSERFYDEETVREICGCLISPAEYIGKGPSQIPLSFRFPHYSVREYLDRNCSIGTVFGPCTVGKSLADRLIKITLLKAQCSDSYERWESGSDTMDKTDIIEAIKCSFDVYCMVSALISLERLPRTVCQDSTITALAIDLLNPSMPHFAKMEAAACTIEQRTRFFGDQGMVLDDNFWAVQWHTITYKEPQHLYNLLVLSESNKEYLELAKTFLQSKNISKLLKAHVSFKRTVMDDIRGGPCELEFDGPFVEIVAQQTMHWQSAFELLIEVGAGFFDPSVALLMSIGSHNDGCVGDCFLDRLVKLGANPNLKGYRVTPLQIATYRLDSKAVYTLLEAGALPNDIGSVDGIARMGELMKYFTRLHGTSPFQMCRDGHYVVRAWEDERDTELKRDEIEALLLQYGATEFSKTSKLDTEASRIIADG